MRRYAITVAVMGFFALAGVGWWCEVPPFVCAMRALAGAAALYVMTFLAGKVMLHILVDAVLRGASSHRKEREP